MALTVPQRGWVVEDRAGRPSHQPWEGRQKGFLEEDTPEQHVEAEPVRTCGDWNHLT